MTPTSPMQVFNLTTYPNLVGLLEALEVDTEPSDMSFALSIDGGALEWGSHGLDSIFAQRRNLLSPSFWLMIWDVLRFGRQAPQVGPQLWKMLVPSACIACCCRVPPHCSPSAALVLHRQGTCCSNCSIQTAAAELVELVPSAGISFQTGLAVLSSQSHPPVQALRPEQAGEYADMCMGEYLRRNRYSSAFIQNYLLPMCAAVWSVPNEKVGPTCGSLPWPLQHCVPVLDGALVEGPAACQRAGSLSLCSKLTRGAPNLSTAGPHRCPGLPMHTSHGRLCWQRRVLQGSQAHLEVLACLSPALTGPQAEHSSAQAAPAEAGLLRP